MHFYAKKDTIKVIANKEDANFQRKSSRKSTGTKEPEKIDEKLENISFKNNDITEKNYLTNMANILKFFFINLLKLNEVKII